MEVVSVRRWSLRNNVSEDDFARAIELTQESCFSVTSEVRAEERAPGVPGGFELDIQSLELFQIAEPYPISPKEHDVEFLMQNRHLWLQSNRQWAVMRIRATIVRAIRDWLDDHGFLNVDTPLITPSAVEGTYNPI